MSDTTKIDKVRVNGVLYDLAGSGSGGISGLYTAPLDLIEADYKGFENTAIDPMALVEQLEKAGINVDLPPVMNENETAVDFYIGSIRIANLDSVNGNSITTETPIRIYIYKNDSLGGYDVEFEILNNPCPVLEGIDATAISLRQIIMAYFTQYQDIYVQLPYSAPNQLGYIINSLEVYCESVDTYLKYYISNLTEFFEEVFIPYNSGSSSS